MSATKPKTEKHVAEPGESPSPRPRRRTKPRAVGLARLRQLRDREAKRIAVSILEVLSGLRTPVEVSESLGVSLTRYYLLEGRALEGLVEACKKRPMGPGKSPERQIAKLKLKIERLESEAARLQALLRVAQRAVGISATSELKKKRQSKATGKGRRRRRKPTVRALRIVEVLREGEKAVAEASARAENGAQGGASSSNKSQASATS